MDEIASVLTTEFGAVEVKEDVPINIIDRKKFTIADGMKVEVSVEWNQHTSKDGSDASINMKFELTGLSSEKDYQQKELGDDVDLDRKSIYESTGINYFTIDPKIPITDNNHRNTYY